MVKDALRRAPLRVAIAEDSGLLRAGIARLITDAGHRVIAEASDGPGFLTVIGEQRPDVAVVDVRMPPGFKDEGLKAALEARRRIPGLPVLVRQPQRNLKRSKLSSMSFWKKFPLIRRLPF